MASTGPSRRRFLRRLGATVGAAVSLGAAGCLASTDDADSEQPPDTVPTPTDRPGSPTATETGPDLPPVSGSWSSFRNDAGNTGATDDPGPVEDARTVWETTVTPGGPVTPPVAADGTVFVVTRSGVVRGFSATDSSVRWTGSRRVSTDVAPVVTDGTLVVADGATLVGLATKDGRERWIASLEESAVGITPSEDRLAVATDSGLTGVSPADGQQLWRHSVDAPVASTPAVGDGAVAVGLESGDVVVVDAAAGERRWRGTVAESGAVATAVAAGRVYCAIRGDNPDAPTGKRVVALDAASGDEEWSVSTDYPVSGGPLATAEGVYVGTVDANREATPPGDGSGERTRTPYPTDTMGYGAALQSLAPDDGSEQWRETFEGTYNFTAGPPSVKLALAPATLLAGIRGGVSAYDPASGDRRWTAPLDGPGVAVTDGVVTTGTEAVALSDGSKLWEYEAGDVVESAPAVVDNTLYVGSDDHHLYAVAASAGTVEWNVRTDGIVRAAPTVDDDTVYVGSLEGTVYAFDRSDGTERWTYDTGDTVEWGGALADGVFYPGLFDSEVLALDAADGTELWRTEPGQPFVTGAPSVGGGALVAGNNGVLRAFETADGSERWGHTFGGEEGRVQSDPAVTDGRAYVHVGESLYAFDVASGEEVWAREIGRSSSAPAIRDGTVYASVDGGVYAFDAGDGSDVWHTPVPEAREIVVGDGAVYGVHYDSPTVALDTEDGTELWQASRGEAASAPALADDYLFFGTTRGAVRALGPRA